MQWIVIILLLNLSLQALPVVAYTKAVASSYSNLNPPSKPGVYVSVRTYEDDLFFEEFAKRLRKNWYPPKICGDDSEKRVSFDFLLRKNGKIDNIQLTKKSWNEIFDNSAAKALASSSPISRKKPVLKGDIKMRCVFLSPAFKQRWPLVEIVDVIDFSEYNKVVAEKIFENWKMPEVEKDDSCILTFDISKPHKVTNIQIRNYAGNLSTENTALDAISTSAIFPEPPNGSPKILHCMVLFKVEPKLNISK